MIASLYLRSQYWLYKYAFNKDFDLLSITDAPINDTHFTIPFNTQKILFIADPFVCQVDREGPLKQINQLYNNTHTIAIFDRGLVKDDVKYSLFCIPKYSFTINLVILPLIPSRLSKDLRYSVKRNCISAIFMN